MKNLKLYNIVIGYMLIYSLLILLSGVWLFFRSQGVEAFDDILKIITHPASKSLHNIIEILTPHIFAMGLLIFIVAHFLLFSIKIKQKQTIIVTLWLLFFMLLNNSIYIFISIELISSGLIKLISLFGFVFLFILLLVMVWVSL